MKKLLNSSKIIIIFTLIFIVATVNQAYAIDNKCYKIEQFEAEQGLRIHSELLVISLTCRKTPGHGTLYEKYKRFTNKNKLLIANYENILISFFRDSGSASPAKDLHTLRTSLANDISQHAINMSVTGFCNYFGGRIDRALKMNRETLRKWAKQVWENQKTSHRLCPKDKALLLKQAADKKRKVQQLLEIQKRYK